MTENEQDSRLNRRKFLRWGIEASLAVTAGATCHWAYTAHQVQKEVKRYLDDPFRIVNMGNTSYPLRETEINAYYAKMYDEIASAKQVADKEHKKLTIVMGEVHTSALSYLHELIIADIAARLGIKDAVVEYDKNALSQLIRDKREEKPSEIHEGAKEKIKLLKPKSIETVLKLSDIISNGQFAAMVDDEVKRVREIRDPRSKFQTMSSYGIFMDEGFTLHCGDPERTDSKGRDRDRFDPIVENAMADAVTQANAHSIAVFGLNHLPVVVEKLRQNKDMMVLAYDVSNGTMEGYMGDKLRITRNTELEQMINEEKIRKPIINGDPVSYLNALQKAFQASIAHRRQKDEIDNRGGMILSIINKNVDPQELGSLFVRF